MKEVYVEMGMFGWKDGLQGFRVQHFAKANHTFFYFFLLLSFIFYYSVFSVMETISQCHFKVQYSVLIY